MRHQIQQQQYQQHRQQQQQQQEQQQQPPMSWCRKRTLYVNQTLTTTTTTRITGNGENGLAALPAAGLPSPALPPIDSLSPLRQNFRHFDNYYHPNHNQHHLHYHHPESPLRRAVTPAVPDEELTSLLQNYLDQQHPRQQPQHHHHPPRPHYKQVVPSGEYSYSIPSGAVLHNSAAPAAAYEGSSGGRHNALSSAAAAAAASPPTNYDAPQSVDSGFASDYPLCSPMPSPMGDHSPPASVSHEKSSSSSFPSPFQHPSPNGQTSYYSGQSHYEHPNPNANAAVSSAPAHVPPPPPPPSMSRAAAASPPSPSSPSAPLPGPSSYDSSAHHAPPLATDHDLSHIVDQVLDSIDAQFPPPAPPPAPPMPPPMPSDGRTAWGHGGARAADGGGGGGEGQFEFVKARSTSNHHQHGGKEDELNWHKVSRNQCVEGERASDEEGGGNHVTSSSAAAAAAMDRLCYKCGSACSRERCPSCGTLFEAEREEHLTSDGLSLEEEEEKEGKNDKKAPNGDSSAVVGRSMSKPVAVARPMAKAAVVGVVEPRVVVKIPWNRAPAAATCGPSESLAGAAATLEGNTAAAVAESESHRGIRSVPRELRSGGGDKKRRNKRRKIEEQPPATASTTTRDLSSRNRRIKTTRSESPELNPSSRERGNEGEDDGTESSGRRRKRRRKIPEINFEMEKGGNERKLQQQQQQQLSKEVGRQQQQQQQQQQFSITETLPEHFRKALMKSLFPTANEEEEDKEQEHTADERKRRKIATIFGSRCPSLANEEKEKEGPLTIGARARSSKVNPLKLIRRFVPGTNQEEYKVRRMEGRGKAMVAIKEEIVVDLASDEDEDNGGDNKNQISREKSISEAYLRAARMPLINVSLVTTKGESENERERAIVRLERLSKREIDRHLKRSRRRGDISEEEEEDDVEVVEEQVFGHENDLKDFKDLIRSEEDPGTARERRGHQQQLRRRKSFASYRNDTTFALGAGGRQPSPLNLEPLKQKRPMHQPQRDCENVHKEGRVDSLADAMGAMRIDEGQQGEGAVSTLSEEQEEKERGDKSALVSGEKEIAVDNRAEGETATTTDDNDDFLEDDVGPFPELDLHMESSSPSAAAVNTSKPSSMPILFSEKTVEEDFNSLLDNLQTVDASEIRLSDNIIRRSDDLATPMVPSSSKCQDNDSGSGDEVVLLDDLVLDALDGGKVKAKVGRPRTYRKAISQIEDEAACRKAVAPDLPPIQPSSSSKAPAKFSFEKERPGEDKWMYCPRVECNFWTRKPHRMERHRLCHPAHGGRALACPDCGLLFATLGKFLRHDRKEHTGEKDYECKICEAEVTDIATHMRTHKAQKDFTCGICTLNFRHKNSLVRHMVQHSGDRPYTCQVCNGSFSCQRVLKDHFRTVHPEHVDNITYILPKRRIERVHPVKNYPPIAPRGSLPPGQTHPAAQQPQHTMFPPAPQQTASYLAPGPNGSMILITQPVAHPQQPQQPQFSLQNIGGGLQVITQHPQPHQLLQQHHHQHPQYLLQQPLSINPFQQPISASLTPTSIGTPNSVYASTPALLSPRESSMLMPPTPEIPTPEPSKEPLLDLPARSLEMPNEDGSVTMVDPERVTFDVRPAADHTTSGGEMVYTTPSGETVQVNILERAILEIPEEFQESPQLDHHDDPNPITRATGQVGEGGGGQVIGDTVDKLEEQRQQREEMLQKERQLLEYREGDEVRRRVIEEEKKRRQLEAAEEAVRLEFERKTEAERMRAEQEAIAKAETEARIRVEMRMKAEEESREKAEQEAKIRAEAEARFRAEEEREERMKTEIEVKLKAEEAERLMKEQEARLRIEAEKKMRIEEEAKLKAKEEEEEVRQRRELEARLKAEVEAKMRTEVEAKMKAEREAQIKAEREARLKAEVEAKLREKLEKERKPEDALEETTFDCGLCGKKYKFENFLKVHQRRPCV